MKMNYMSIKPSQEIIIGRVLKINSKITKFRKDKENTSYHPTLVSLLLLSVLVEPLALVLLVHCHFP